MPIIGMSKVKKAINDLVVEQNKKVKAVYIQGLTNVAIGTPVNEGQARNNWFLSVGRLSNESTKTKSKGASGSLAQIEKIPFWILDKDIYYTNNTPYIEHLEYGLYPVDVKNGTYVKGYGYQKLSSNGFSLQAGQGGWVRGEILRMKQSIRLL